MNKWGFLICNNCGGYYELLPGESPEDFSECQCGGELVYKGSINSKSIDKDYSPSITSVASSRKANSQSKNKSNILDMPKALIASLLVIVAILFKFGIIGIAISAFMRSSNWQTTGINIFIFFLVVFFLFILRKYFFK